MSAAQARQLPDAQQKGPVEEVEFPEKLTPLMEQENRKRYYILYGGRDSGRSWAMARALLLLGLRDPLLILCAREVMKSIAESIYRLLVIQIEHLGLKDWYDVQETTIKGRNGCEFIFAGLRTVDAKKLKSYESVDIVMVEEAENVSKRSWNILIPTIRAPRSEIWVNFNPYLDTDETYQRFVAEPQEDSWVQKVTWRDNPWFSEVLDSDRRRMQRQDPDEYDNVYEGNARLVVAGAIYAKEIRKMVEEQRFRNVPYDPRLRVHTVWDLGWNDQTSIIFAQRLHSELRVIDYMEESFMRYDEWAKLINDKPYVYGDHWLPHDGEIETQQAGGVSAQKQLTPLLGKKPKIIERTPSVELPIRAARMMFPRAYVDKTKCLRLMECLKRFARAVPDSSGEPGAPIKNEYRHGADAWGGLAMIVDKLTNDGREARKLILEDNRPVDPGMGRAWAAVTLAACLMEPVLRWVA